MSKASPAVQAMLSLQSAGAPPRAFLGFDGYIDSIYHVVLSRDAKGGTKLFDGIGGFGKIIASRAGKSGGFELSRVSHRLGGNAPLMARALEALDVDTDLVGALGQPALDPVFEELRKDCALHSVAAPSLTVALEFDDGKIMLGDTQPFETLDWNQVVENLGMGKISSLVGQAGLLALVNWANMHKATDLWQGLLENIMEKHLGGNRKKIFFDLADLTRCGKAETKAMLAILRRFRAFGEVNLGMNENEAVQLADKLDMKKSAKPNLESLGKALSKALDLDCLILHPREGALVFEGPKMSKLKGKLVKKPLLSTGGGDNFNAGYCAGLLYGLSHRDAAELAIMVSSHYVTLGKSPRRAELLGNPA